MPRPQNHPPQLDLPPEPDLAKLPRYVDKPTFAAIHYKYYGPIAARTLSDWDVEWRVVNGRHVGETSVLLKEAERRFNSARVVRGGRQPAFATETITT
jgi:hypothetical protein